MCSFHVRNIIMYLLVFPKIWQYLWIAVENILYYFPSSTFRVLFLRPFHTELGYTHFYMNLKYVRKPVPDLWYAYWYLTD